MIILGWILAVLVTFWGVFLFALAWRDSRRLRIGKQFRAQRGSPINGAFLAMFTDDELRDLQAPRLGWMTKKLPDPRDASISPTHAQIYWRIAVRRHESNQMIVEITLVILSGLLGITLGELATTFIANGYESDVKQTTLIVIVGVIVIAISFAISTKTVMGRKWQEGIDMYRRIGWPEKPETFSARSILARWMGK